MPRDTVSPRGGACAAVGYGTRVGRGRVIPGQYPAAKDVHCKGILTAERAPEALQGLEWVVRMPVPVRPHPPLQGPFPAVTGAPRANAASQPIRTELRSIYCKVSQNRVVSP